jgi:hypothetical protein
VAVQFFNFTNEETFHFFRWICEREPSGPESLVADAFQRAEHLDDTEFADEDICEIAKSRLAEQLEEILYNAAPDLDPDTNSFEIGIIWQDAEGRASSASLLQPIFALALARIDFQVVAEALLIRAGKWNPSREPPEVK